MSELHRGGLPLVRRVARFGRSFGFGAAVLALALIAPPLAGPAQAGGPSLTLAASPTATRHGATVTFDATVTTPDQGAAGGSVDFVDGDSGLGRGELVAGGGTLAAAVRHSCALASDGGLRCWGLGLAGALGDGTGRDSATPVAVIGLPDDIAMVAAGGDSTCAAGRGGALWCWGRNDLGQVGDGTAIDAPAPVMVADLAAVVGVAVGTHHGCAWTAAGTVWCWGGNEHGQIGDGTTTRRPRPVAVTGLPAGVVAVSAQGNHTCAIDGGGGLWCWGANSGGQLGDGSRSDRLAPVAVVGLTAGVSAVAAGAFHSCAVTVLHEVSCWGLNGSGQLGDGTTIDRAIPTAVAGLAAGAVAIAVGRDHSCARTVAGAAACWGSNGSGQIGDGGGASARSRPVTPAGLGAGVVAVAAGQSHGCAVLDSGALRCWGSGGNGQLGDGAAVGRTTPVTVDGLSALLTARARLVTAALATGSRAVSARWAGDAARAALVSPPVTVVVARAGATTALAVSATQPTLGDTVTLAATVDPQAPASDHPTGTVIFRDGASDLGSAELVGGVARFTTTGLALGGHQIVAQHAGDANFEGSASAVQAVTVKPAPVATTTTLAATPSPAAYGQVVRLAATVTAAQGNASGSVTFYDGAAVLGTAPLVGGRATFDAAALTVGAHGLGARYPGSADAAGSSAPALTLGVEKAATAVALASSATTARPGQALSLTATVAAVTGGGAPAGAVTFADGATVLGVVALAGGRAVLTNVAPLSGRHALSAGYGGSASHAPALSTPVAVSVDGRSGATFVVNSRRVGGQSAPRVAADGTGFVVVWQSEAQDGGGLGVYGQRLRADGGRLGGEFRVNTTTAGAQSLPAIAALAKGGFVVAWQSDGQDGSDLGIYLQRYGAGGARVGTETRVNATTTGRQAQPALAALADGGFVVVWASNQTVAARSGIWARRFDADGKASGEFRVDTSTGSDQSQPAIAATPDGGFVVVWRSVAGAVAKGIVGQRWSAAGKRVGGEFRIDGDAAHPPTTPVVVGLPAGGFAVAWNAGSADGGGLDLWAQRFTATGARVGAPARVNATVAGDQSQPALAVFPGGGWLAVWRSAAGNGVGLGALAQRFDATGKPADVEAAVDATAPHDPSQPAAAAWSARDFVVVWTATGVDGAGAGIVAQRYGLGADAALPLGDGRLHAASKDR